MTTWKPIPGLIGLYEASDDGRVRSVERTIIRATGAPMRVRAKPIKLRPHPRGYWMVSLAHGGKYRHALVHQLVAEAFIGPRPAGMCVAHWNGNKLDNRLTNLRYATRQENANDAVRLKEMRRGSRHTNAKLTEDCIRKIRRMDTPQSRIAAMFGVSQTLVSQIKRGLIWRHVN